MIRTGTAGWAYDDWKGPFYARDTPREKMLAAFAQVFDAVEVDATFHAAPKRSVLEGWAAQTPPHFRFAPKLPRTLTHDRGLVGVEDDALAFAHLLQDGLGTRLGAILVQMPPEFGPGQIRTLAAFAKAVGRRGIPWVVELRDTAWSATSAAQRLPEFGLHTAATDRCDPGGPLRYVRLLGAENSVPRFDTRVFDRGADLDAWARRLRDLAPETEALVFARNFFEGHAPATLTDLRARLGLTTPEPPGRHQRSLFE